MDRKLLIKNRRAFHDYEILEKFEAGLVLVGTEVKSIREHHAVLQDGYVTVKGGDLFLVNISITPFSHGNIHNHEEKRDRKLLLHKREISRLKKELQTKGTAIIPLAIYLKKNRIKVEIAVARGKKQYDKREALKKREQMREIARETK